MSKKKRMKEIEARIIEIILSCKDPEGRFTYDEYEKKPEYQKLKKEANEIVKEMMDKK